MYNVILHGIVIVLAVIFYNNKDKLFQNNSWIPFTKSKNTSFLDDPEFSNNSFRFYKGGLDHGYFSAQGMWQEKNNEVGRYRNILHSVKITCEISKKMCKQDI